MYNVKKVFSTNNDGVDIIHAHHSFNDEFINTMSTVFRWARWIGIVGLERFLWKLYGLLLLCLLLAIESQAIWKVVKALAGWAIDTVGHRSITARLSGTVFYTSALLGMIECNRLSYSWKEMSKYWASIEYTLSIKYVPADRTLKKKMYCVTAAILFTGLVVNLLNAVSAINFHCELSLCLRKIILGTHGFMILEFEYSDWIGIVILFMNITAVFVRNLHEIFIILISMGLTSRYKRLNECVATVTERYNTKIKWCKNQEVLQVHMWRKIREAYMKQANLVRHVNNSLGGPILVSTFFNFYFICFQLFLGLVIHTENFISVNIFEVTRKLCKMFQRSLEKFGVMYKNYIGDGDSKTYSGILKAAPYDNQEVVKKKRMGKRPGIDDSIQGISSDDGLKNLFYFIQLIWICGRTIYSTLKAADVNKYSKRALPYLYNCSTQFYNIEIERLQRHLSRDYVALTGMGFFYINRSLVLQMAGTVVTYVLMLVQYDRPDDQVLRNNTDTSFK